MNKKSIKTNTSLFSTHTPSSALLTRNDAFKENSYLKPLVGKPFTSILLSSLLFTLSGTQTVHAHGNEKESQEGGVQHAQEDAYWAEKAQNYPKFVPKSFSRAAQRSASEDGAWGPIIQWPHIPVTAANLPDGRILTFASNQKTRFPAGTEFTYAATWNPSNNQFVERNHNSHDMFCGHLSTLEDGRIFVNGGTNHVKTTSTFDYRTNTWQKIDQMNRGRWYPTTVALPTGSILTAIGSSGGQYPELWTEGQGWKSLTGASLQTPILSYTQFFERNWWPLLHLDPRGKVFHSGPTPKMHSINTEGLGSVTKVGPEIHDWYPKHGTTVMYDEGKLLVAGGAVSGTNSTSTNKAMIIDITGEEPQVTQIAPMTYARKFQNGVMLPNGEVLVVGGNSSGVKFSDSGTILPVEIWNPETKAWRTIDSLTEPRNYHSIALLLTDGRILSAGGGLCGCAADHQNGQVLTPPYLYNEDGSLATRPVISNAPSVIKNGQVFNLQSDTDITKFSLIKMSSTTHAVNTDLRFLKLPFTHDNNGNYQLSAHNNINVMTPGYWMLFAVNSKGVPSIAKVVQVSTNGIPRITQPENQIGTVGENVSLSIIASDPQGENLRYEASGLPQGLNINANTGVISGRLNTAGIYSPEITVSDAESSTVAQFNWVVYPPGTTPGVSYEYFVGNWTKLPDFNTLTPASTGTFTNFNITPRAHNDNFAFRLSARIKITQPGSYTFYTRSDDGSRLWIDGNLVVDNDGIHASQERSGAINLTAGEHLIVVGFFELTGEEGLTVQYSSSSISKRQIPASLLVQSPQQNNAPTINNPGDQTSSLNATVNLNMIASDANGDTLSYSATGLPSGLSISPSTGSINGTTSSAGSFAVTVTVNDGQGESATTSFNWDIIAPISITPIQSPPKQSGTSVNYNAVVSGGNSLRYRWNFGDGSATTNYSGSPSISHAFSNAGTYVVTLFVQSGSDTPIEHQFVQAIYAPTTTSKATNSSSIAYEVVSNSNGNNRVWNVNPDNNTVTAFDTVMHAKLVEISVGKAPHALAFAPNGRLWVSNKDSSSVSIIDTSTQKVIQTINFQAGSQPFGIAFSPTGNYAYLTLEGSGKLLRLNPVSGKIQSTLEIGERPRHVSVNSTGDKIYVSRFITPPLPDEDTANPKTTLNGNPVGGEVIVVNASNFTISKTIILEHSERQDAEHSARGIPNYLGPVVISPDGKSAWVSSKQDNIKRGVLRDGNQLTHDSAVRSISSKINLSTEQENTIARVDHDNGGIASSAIFSEHGNYLFVALEGSREIAVVDGYSNEEFYRFDAGRAPQGLALSPDGLTLYSHNFMDRSITVHDISPIINARDTNTALVSVYNTVSNERLSLSVLNGKQLFYDARDQRLAREQYSSCASCHNDGDTDGRTWDMTGFGEGLRNTIGLIGHGGVSQGPLHWSANFDEVQDFEGQIRTLAGGTGLMTDNDFHDGTHSQPLGDSKTGLSSDLDDLAAYVQSLKTVPASPFKNQDGSLTTSALQGKQLFTDKGCDTCHSGQHFTDSAPNNLHDIGTLRSSSGRRLNAALSGIDTPTLLGLWLTAPYLHNGSANTLEEAIAAHTTNVATLTPSERGHLANFLKQLDSTINVSSSTSNEISVGDITVNGQASDWNGLTPFSIDPDDTSGANDPINWQSVSFAHDSDTLYLLYKNYGNIDPESTTGSYLSWGRQVYIDTDKNSTTGYQVGAIGADYILEANQILHYSGTGSSWNWTRVGEGASQFNGNIAELSISRGLLGNPDSVYVVFMGNNAAYGGSSNDLYPDSLNSNQGSQQSFEYEFSSDSTPPQGAPVAQAQSISMVENTSKEITLQGSDSENDPLTFSIVTQPSSGTLTGTGRNLTYTPDTNFTGSDSFSFIVNDGSQNSDPATVTLTINPEQTGVMSNPVHDINIDGEISEWIGLTRFADDPNDISGSDNTIDWQNVALAHNNDKLFILYKNRRQIETGRGSYLAWGWQTYFDTDNNPLTGYQLGAIGADYILEGGQLLRYIGTGTDWEWTTSSSAQLLYNNDTVELGLDRSAIGNPSSMRVVFSGNNQAYEGRELDYYPDNAEGLASGEQFFVYSLAQSLQVVNRPLGNSQNLSVQPNAVLSIDLSDNANASQTDLQYIIISEPSHGELTGNGANRSYNPSNGYQGTDQIRYVIQNGTFQSSIITIELKVGEGNTSNGDEGGSGGGSLPISILLPLLILLSRRGYTLRATK